MKTNLKNLTGSALVKMYNEAAEALGRKTVKKFSNKQTSIKRTTAILSELKPAAKTTRKPKTYDLPFVGLQHKLRSGSIRDRFFAAMSAKGGASSDDLSEIVAEFDAERGTGGSTIRRARSYVRIMHTYHGFGIRQLSDGNLVVIASDDS